ncbi:hypothetical protein HN800_01330 [bacterium]|jgi:hypothetical protein|nr:hypothetical protein [bacterium]MBT4334905.1 hypothetical protein [bacterium]MBT4495834.1 hypothetical protein [bacterium]MBT4763711.1 hypothetical protein [bacterium]MBT5401082.1 hypothetical protein [bacterium]
MEKIFGLSIIKVANIVTSTKREVIVDSGPACPNQNFLDFVLEGADLLHNRCGDIFGKAMKAK